jgi:CheY-like chemotaxis protein
MKRNILLVDDDASLLATLGDFLESEGYSVSKAESGEKALAMLRVLKPDLIVLDMSMPGMGGMGVLDRLRLPDGSMRYPVLVLTARARMAEYFADKQVDGFIAKPCDPEDLALEVSRIMFQRGATASAEASTSFPAVLLGEPDPALRERIAQTLDGSAYEVRAFAGGAELLESAVLQPPSVIVMRLEMEGPSADVIVGMLQKMSRTRDLPVLVYGIDAPDARLEHVAALDDRHCEMLATTDPAKLLATVNRVFGH